MQHRLALISFTVMTTMRRKPASSVAAQRQELRMDKDSAEDVPLHRMCLGRHNIRDLSSNNRG